MRLAYQKLGSGAPLIILHGLFGMSDNWMAIGRKLADHFTVYLLDQRNHGRSPHAPEFNYPALTGDLAAFTKEHELNGINIIGHSMGGKTALFFSEKFPAKINKIIIADIALRSYSHPHFRSFIEALSSINLENIHSRKEADAVLSKIIAQLPIRQFLLKNLYRDDHNQFHWRINLPSISRNLEYIMGAYHPINPFPGPLLFLRGKKSNYINDEDIQQIMNSFPQVRIESIPNASHWIHADAPQEFIHAVISFLIN